MANAPAASGASIVRKLAASAIRPGPLNFVFTRSAALSAVGDAVTTLQDIQDGAGTQAVTTLELMGQLSGDIGPLLGSLNAKLGGARLVRISCALLIRADFVAASDLLNWVVSKRNEARQISFTDVHRLVGLMFSAMGLNEQASVQLRQS